MSGAQIPRTEREIRVSNLAFAAIGIRLEGEAGRFREGERE